MPISNPFNGAQGLTEMELLRQLQPSLYLTSTPRHFYCFLIDMIEPVYILFLIRTTSNLFSLCYKLDYQGEVDFMSVKKIFTLHGSNRKKYVLKFI